MNKLNRFQSVIYSKNYDVLCVTETWLSSTITNNEILPSTYTIYRNDRINRGGGVLIAVKHSLTSQLHHLSDTIELIAVNLGVRPKLLLVCLYIPPNSSMEYQQEALAYISNLQNNTNTLILGDFNAPDIDWPTQTAGSPFSRDLCNTLYQFNFMQLVSSATHRAGNILDLVLTNAPQRIENICIETSSSLNSDHFPISANILSQLHTRSGHGTEPHSSSSSLNTLNYRKANLPALVDDLSNTLVQVSSICSSVQPYWSDLKDAIARSTLNCIPKVVIPTKQTPPWFNASVRHMLNKVHTLRRRLRRHPTHMLEGKLTHMENDLQSIIQSAKEHYLSHLVSMFGSNPSKLYSYLTNLSKSKFESPFIQHDNEIIHDSYKKATLFNEFFNSTLTTSTYVLPPVSSLPAPSSFLCDISFSEAEVYEILTHLNPTKAGGCDEIHPLVLKHCSDILSAPLSLHFNVSISLGSIPQEWKIHKVRPIPKGGDSLKISNYRPISLLCIASKVMERAIYNQIITFIRPKLSRLQFGFLKGRSCLSQLLTSFAKMFDDLDRGGAGAIDAVFLDFSKAFDSVPHNELLYKLWRIGITGNLWQWFREYLSERKHFVHIDGSSSGLLPVKSGVPQGSILGPLLFLVYVNDLPECITYASCRLFADDAKLLKSISSVNDCLQLQHDLSSLDTWCSTWNLRLNEHKCTHLRLLSLIVPTHFQPASTTSVIQRLK